MARKYSLYRSTGRIDERDLSSIIRSAVFFSDSVLVRASARVNFATEGDRRISRQLDELHEAGLLRLWGHEYEIGPKDILRPEVATGGASRRVDVICSADDVSELASSVDDAINVSTKDAYAMQPQGSFKQGVTEVVKLRTDLLSFGVADILQCGQMENASSSSTIIGASIDKDGGGIHEAVITDIFMNMRGHDFSGLTLDEMLKLKKNAGRFRQLIDDAILQVARQQVAPITREDVSRQILAEFGEINRLLQEGNIVKNISGEAMWDLSGAAIPPLVALKYGSKIFRWQRERKKARPFLLLSGRND